MRQVKQKDRDPRTNEMRAMLKLLGFGMTYVDTDLLMRGLEVFEKKGGKMDLRDSTRLHMEWEKRWDKYFEKDEKTDTLP